MATDARRRFWIVGGVAWALLTLLSVAWTLATPIAAAPDEPAHIIKAAAVARWEFLGTPGTNGVTVRVPEWAAQTQAETCFAFRPDVTADCAPAMTGDGRLVNGTTTAGLYNPTYYLLVGWPSLLFQNAAGVYAMRIVAALVASLMTAAGLALISTWRAPVIPMAGALIAATPMTVFLAGVVNPSSLENAAAFTAFAGVLTLVTQMPTDRRLVGTCGILLIATAVGVNIRGLSVLWFALALLPLLLLKRARLAQLFRQRAVLITAGAAVLAAGVALAWVFVSNSLGAGLDTPPAGTPGIGESPLHGFLLVLSATFEYDQGLIGVFGWLDAPAHPATFAIWSMFIGALIVLGGLLLRKRRLLLMLAFLGLLVLLPAVLQAAYITRGGIIWQGRYALPLLTFMLMSTAAMIAQRVRVSRRLATRLAAILGGLWATGQLFAFLSALKRYAVGAHGGWAAMAHPAWQPPVGLVPVTFIAVVALGGALAFLLVAARRAQRSTGPAGEMAVTVSA